MPGWHARPWWSRLGGNLVTIICETTNTKQAWMWGINSITQYNQMEVVATKKRFRLRSFLYLSLKQLRSSDPVAKSQRGESSHSTWPWNPGLQGYQTCNRTTMPKSQAGWHGSQSTNSIVVTALHHRPTYINCLWVLVVHHLCSPLQTIDGFSRVTCVVCFDWLQHCIIATQTSRKRTVATAT